MAHLKLALPMPAERAVVFDAFHYHRWRARWDSLVRDTRIEGGAPCPSVGAVTRNAGRGWMGALAMRTQFVSYQPGVLAAAVMLGRSFPFARWAASMRHRDAPGGSLMLYSASFEAAPAWLGPLVAAVFEAQTRRRFARLQGFLAREADAVRQWQRQGRPP